MLNVYMVLAGSAASYARVCIDSLLRRVDQPIRLSLVTDSVEDHATYDAILAALPQGVHETRVLAKADVDEVANEKLARFAEVRAFREGHPCWRKITDPVVLADDGDDVVVLDPDLYFPNRFRFDRIPKRGVLLMWQPPSCLLPEAAVQRVFDMGERLAHHVDIGVAMLRAPFDWEWLEDFCRRLEPGQYAKFMHVEAIVWSAYAMRVGGGHLNPAHYRCFRNHPWKRVALSARLSHLWLLKQEPFTSIKVYHAGGWPKRWLKQAERENLFPEPGDVMHSLPLVPYVEYTRALERRKQTVRRLIAKTGVLKRFMTGFNDPICRDDQHRSTVVTSEFPGRARRAGPIL